MTKSLIAILLAITFTISNVFADDKLDANNVENYVHILMNQSLSILNDSKIPANLKSQKVRAMLSKNLDGEWMAKFSLGREVKALSPGDVGRFIAAYTKYVVNSYASAVNGYKGEKIEIKSVNSLNDGFFMVKTQVVKTDGNVINVEYLAHSVGKEYKVCDIVTEGISLVNSQRSEFSGVLGNEGINALISELEKRTSK